MERREVRGEKNEVSGVQEAQEGVRLWCTWAREGTQGMREVGSGVGICNEREVM